MEHHEQIFDIFQRLNVTADYPGTGIGLAIVRKAMERMGGRAWAESKPGAARLSTWRFPRGDKLSSQTRRSLRHLAVKAM